MSTVLRGLLDSAQTYSVAAISSPGWAAIIAYDSCEDKYSG